MIAHLLDLILGAHCPHGCGVRVYPRDRTDHHVTHHGPNAKEQP